MRFSLYLSLFVQKHTSQLRLLLSKAKLRRPPKCPCVIREIFVDAAATARRATCRSPPAPTRALDWREYSHTASVAGVVASPGVSLLLNRGLVG